MLFSVQEFELHKKISVAVQERTRYIQLLFDENLKVQALEVQLAGVKSDLSNVSASPQVSAKGSVDILMFFKHAASEVTIHIRMSIINRCDEQS